MADQVLARVADVIIDFTALDHAGSISPTHRLVDDLGMNDVDRIEVTMEVEEEFDIEISDDEHEQFNTVQDIVDCVNRHLAD